MAPHHIRAALMAATLLAPAAASAFCGFYVSGSSEGLYNKATRAALLRDGTRTVLTMSNDYDGPAEDFAMVVPVPVVLSRDNVRTLPHDVFNHLEALTAPRLVEYWEQDPCATDRYPRELLRLAGVATSDTLAVQQIYEADPRAVRVEARFTVGEYEVVILSADESTALEAWLRSNRYNIPRGAAEALGPYVRGEWKFFVARVDITKAERRPGGGVRLSPLRMHYDSTELRLPVRLGLLNAPRGPQDLIVYVLHPSARFEVANYRNAFIPTNLELTEGARDQFAQVYGALFDATLQTQGPRAVITEYAWSTGGCDPCPSPPLSGDDLATLGGDVAPEFRGSSMVVTRLHARYNAATLSDDLVFREALPVTGGHEVPASPGSDATPNLGATATSMGNAFQARYVIRHPWTGPVTCAEPRRGVWGAQPGHGDAAVMAAREIASAPRDEVDLRTLVRTRVPTLDLTAKLRLPDTSSAPPPVIPSTSLRRGCACDVPARATGGGLCVVAAFAAVALRRRQRPTRSITETSARPSTGQ